MTDAELARAFSVVDGQIAHFSESPALDRIRDEMARLRSLLSHAARIAAGDLTGCTGIPEWQAPRPELVSAEEIVEQLRGLLEGEPDGVGTAAASSGERMPDLPPGVMLTADYREWQERLGVVPCQPAEPEVTFTADSPCVTGTIPLVRDGEVLWTRNLIDPLSCSESPSPDIIDIADAPADDGPAPLTEATGWMRGAMERRRGLWARVLNRRPED